MNMLMCLSKYYSRTVGMPWRRADMMELADMQDLGSCAARRVGSSPTIRIRGLSVSDRRNC